MFCFRDNQGSGNECCYKRDGSLLVGHPHGGSMNKVDPQGTQMDYWNTIRMYYKEDIVPYLLCCTTASVCYLYYERRPSDNGTRYRPPVPGKLTKNICDN